MRSLPFPFTAATALLLAALLLPCTVSADVPSPSSAASPTAAVDSAPPVGNSDDLELSRQVARRLQSSDGLRDVNVTVQSGVARLDGRVLELDERERAAQIASQQPGVSAVDNQVQLSTRLLDRLDAAVAIALDKLVRLVAALPLLLVAIAVVMLSWWVGSRLGTRIGRRSWRSANPYLDGLIRNLVQWLVLLAGVLAALDLLGATSLVGAVLGSAGVVGLVLGFAFKDIAENYVAGILLSLRRPFSPGDSLRIDTYEGKVVALTSRATILMTFDGNRLSLPNALVFKSVVLNFSGNPKRRFDFSIPVDAATSLGNAQEIALESIASIDGVLSDPGPSSIINGYDGNGITLQFFGWVDQRQNAIGGVRSAAIRAVRNGFFSAGIESPRSIQYVVSTLAPELGSAAAVVTPGPAASVALDDNPEATPQDTSINRDIDEQLAAAQRAHSADDLMSSNP